MSIASVSSLIEILRTGRLLNSVQLEEVEREIQSGTSDPRLLARELVRRGWITPFQINQLFQNQGKDLVLGPYLLLERLGAGPSGQTYKALHQPSGRVVAVKVLGAGYTPDTEARARCRERAAADAALDHTHIAAFHEVIDVGEKTLVATEFVEGTDLAHLVQKSGPLPPAEAFDYAHQAALALLELHNHNLYHGSAAASELILTSPDRTIKVLRGDLTNALSHAGEKSSGTVQGDIHALGATFFYLLTAKALESQDVVPALAAIEPDVAAGIVKRMVAEAGAVPFTNVSEVIEALSSPAIREPSLAVVNVAGAAVDALATPLTPSAGTTPEIVAAEREGGPDSITDAREARATPEGRSDEALVALTDSVTSDSTLSGSQPSLVAKAPTWGAWLSKRARQRSWQAAAVSVLALGAVALAWTLMASNQSGLGESRESTGETLRDGKGQDAGSLKLVAVLGGAEGRHWAPARCAAWSPKQDIVATGGDDSAIRLWDAETLVARGVLLSHKGAVNCVAFSPDGRYLLSGGDDRALILWEVATKKEVAPLIAHTAPIRSVAFSSDGKQAISGGQDGFVVHWDVETRESITNWNASDKNAVTALAFSGDNKTILVGDSAGKARLWDLRTQKSSTAFEGHTDAVTGAVFAPDGKALFTASADKMLIHWDVAGTKIRAYEGNTAAANGLAYDAAHKRLWSAGADGTIRRWDVDRGTEIMPPLTGHKGPVSAIALSPSFAKVLSAGNDHTVRLWDAASGAKLHQPTGHTMAVQCVALSPDGRYVVTGAADNTVRVWRTDRKEQAHNLKGSKNGVTAVAFSSDSRKVVAAFGDNAARVWDVESEAIRGKFTWTIGAGSNVACIPGGDRIVTGNVENSPPRVVLRDLAKGEEIRVLAVHLSPMRCLAVSTNGKLLLSGSEDWKIRLSDIETAKELRRLVGPTGAILSVAFGPEERTALAVAADRTVWRWDLNKEQEAQLADLPEAATFVPTAAAIAPDARALAYCGGDGRLVLWDIEHGKVIQREQLSGPIARVVFSADGRFLATANANGTASVFRVTAK